MEFSRDVAFMLAMEANIMNFGKWLHLSKLTFIDSDHFWSKRLEKDYGMACNSFSKNVYKDFTEIVAARKRFATFWCAVNYVKRTFPNLFRDAIRVGKVHVIEMLAYSSHVHAFYVGDAARAPIRICDDVGSSLAVSYSKQNPLTCIITPAILKILVLSKRLNVRYMNYLALRQMCHHGQIESVKIILEYCLLDEMHQKYKYQCLLNACVNYHYELLSCLLKDDRFHVDAMTSVLKRLKKHGTPEALSVEEIILPLCK